jgi:chromosome partitioning protein
MKIIVFSEKGGSGKTTLAVHLAVALDLPLLDLDQQQSATKWLQRRDPPHRLLNADAKLPDAYVIDCPPRFNAGLIRYLEAADVAVLPVRASFNDLVILPDAVAFLEEHARKVAIVGADIDLRSNDLASLGEVLQGYENIAYVGHMSHRAAYRRAGLAGKLAGEVDPVAKDELIGLVRRLKGVMK